MKIRSRKAKGRRLQNWVRDELLSVFTNLSNDDIYCAIMGESGADVKFSAKAQKLLPYSIECKNKDDSWSPSVCHLHGTGSHGKRSLCNHWQ